MLPDGNVTQADFGPVSPKIRASYEWRVARGRAPNDRLVHGGRCMPPGFAVSGAEIGLVRTRSMKKLRHVAVKRRFPLQ